MKKLTGFLFFLLLGAVVEAGAQTPNFTLDRNLFKPSTDLKVTSVFTPVFSGNSQFILYDTAGEVIKNFKPGALTANVPQTFTWDGKNDSGEPVASGFYFFRFTVELGTFTKKLLVVR